MRLNRSFFTMFVGLVSVSSLFYIKRLIEIRQTVSTKEAIFNGQKMLNAGTNIFAFTAHPDDLEIFAAGTLKILSQRNCKITLIDVSSGEKGVNKKDLAQIRQEEQKKAGRVLGVKNIEFLNLPDLNLAKEDSLQPTIKEILLKGKPDVVLAFDYKYPIRIVKHSDHESVGKTVSLLTKQLLDRKTRLYLYGSRYPDTIIDISGSIEDKSAALRCHKSQLRFHSSIYDYVVKFFAKYVAHGTFLTYAESFRKS